MCEELAVQNVQLFFRYSMFIVLPHLLGQDLFRFLWLWVNTLYRLFFFVYVLQCLTGKVDNNKNNNNKLIYYMLCTVRPLFVDFLFFINAHMYFHCHTIISPLLQILGCIFLTAWIRFFNVCSIKKINFLKPHVLSTCTM